MGFEAHVPDVIRHTALRSSDFPPPADIAYAKPPAATARSSCQVLVYRKMRPQTRRFNTLQWYVLINAVRSACLAVILLKRGRRLGGRADRQ